MINLLKNKYNFDTNSYYYFHENNFEIPLKFIDQDQDVIQLKTQDISQKSSVNHFVNGAFNVYKGSIVLDYMRFVKMEDATYINEKELLQYLFQNAFYKIKYIPLPVEIFEIEENNLLGKKCYYIVSKESFQREETLNILKYLQDIRCCVVYEEEFEIEKHLDDSNIEKVHKPTLKDYFNDNQDTIIIYSEEELVDIMKPTNDNLNYVKYLNIFSKDEFYQNIKKKDEQVKNLSGIIVHADNELNSLLRYIDLPVISLEETGDFFQALKQVFKIIE